MPKDQRQTLQTSIISTTHSGKKKKKRQNGNNLRLVDPLRPSKPNTQIHQKYQKLLAIYKTHKGDNFSVSDENASSLPLDPLIPKREDS